MDAEPVEITDEYIRDILARGKGYYLVFLTRGPNFSPTYDTTDHLRYLLGLREAGIININGPVMDDTDIRGISIYNMADPAKVDEYVSGDPAVASGHFAYRILPWFSIPGDSLA